MNHPTYLYPTSEPAYKSGVTLKYSQGPTGEERPQGELESGLAFLVQPVTQPGEWRGEKDQVQRLLSETHGLSQGTVFSAVGLRAGHPTEVHG